MYIALLRGINVGGNNVIRMADLKLAFEEMGFGEVKTYIQSGNVLFHSGSTGVRRITDQIEAGLSARFGYAARVVVRSKRQYTEALKTAPPSWGKSAAWKHNALFVVAGMRASTILKELPPLRDTLEEATCGPGVIFWSGSVAGLARTTMMKVAGLPVYKNLTVRNHKTTRALLELMNA